MHSHAMRACYSTAAQRKAPSLQGLAAAVLNKIRLMLRYKAQA